MKKSRFFWGTIAFILAFSAYSAYKEYHLNHERKSGKAIEWRLEEIGEKIENEPKIDPVLPEHDPPKVYVYPH